MPTHPAKLNYHGNMLLDDQHEEKKMHSETVKRESVSHLFIFMNPPVSQNRQISCLFVITGLVKFGKMLAIFSVNVSCNIYHHNYNICNNWGEKTD